MSKNYDLNNSTSENHHQTAGSSTAESLSSAFINSIISNSGVTRNSAPTTTKTTIVCPPPAPDKDTQQHDGVKWNITNSAQNIVSALVDPSKQYDYAFRREWNNTFSSGPTGMPTSKLSKPSAHTKKDAEFRSKLKVYLVKLEERRVIKQKENSNEEDHQAAEQQRQANRQSKASVTEDSPKNGQVPDIFMQDQLDLSNLETFNCISNLTHDEQTKDSKNGHLDDSTTTYYRYSFNKLQLRQLQRKFTDYLDIIEENLAGQISIRSGDFFQVMSSVDSVMDEISLAIKSVTSLRKKCATLNNALILPNLRNIQLTKSRNNADEVLARLNTIATLCKVQSKIQLLLSSSDFVGALNLIAKSRRILENDLVGVVCLRHLESQLNEIEKVIGTMMQQEFVTLITSEWNRPVIVTQIDHIMNLENSNSETSEARLFEHERVLSIVQGMIRINRLNFEEYFEHEASIAISTCVKQTLIEFLSDEDDCIGNDDKVSHDVYKTVQLINYTKWVAMIRIVFMNLLSILKRIKIVYKVILSTLDQVNSSLSDDTLCAVDSTPSESSQFNLSPSPTNAIPDVFRAIEADAKVKILNNVKQGKKGLQSSFQAVCNFANRLTLNLIECRIKESNFDKLLATEFINLSKLIEDFTRSFSDICDRDQMTLRSLLQTQADKFVNKFHDERKKRIKSNLDIEQWKMVEDVPQDFQQLITNIVDDKIPMWQCLEQDKINEYHKQQEGIKNQKLPQESDKTNDTKDQPMSNSAEQADTSSRNQQQQPRTRSTKIKESKKPRRFYVVANQQNFVIVNSAINLTRMVIDYCRCAHDIKFLSSELLAKLFDLLHLYNSTTYQLVYSAGALQIAGLKTITARNLVVSQRSIKLILLILPSVKFHFEQLLPEDHRSMLKRFDEISLTYLDHCGKIPDRVSSIAKDVINLQLKEWEAKPPVPSQQFCAVSQHLMRLHDNIQDAMPLDELKDLFMKIHMTFKEVLRSHLVRLKIANDSGPQQWLVTQELAFYKMNSSKLSVFKAIDMNFDDLWSNLDIPS